MDGIVDHYFLTLEEVKEAIDDLEKDIIESFSSEHKARIHKLKQEMLSIRRAVAPLRELVRNIVDTENGLILESTEVYLRDLRDHIIQITDLAESYRENLNSLQDLYLSELSFRMNSVMQVLTIIATIFIPLTFLAGIYGMNFNNMPELHWENGYFILLSVMAVVTLLMIWYFKRKDWL